MVLEFDSFDLNQSKMSYFRVRNRYILLIPQFSIKIININFMRKIDQLLQPRRSRKNAQCLDCFVHFFEQLYDKASRQTHIAQGKDFVMRMEFCKFFYEIMECTYLVKKISIFTKLLLTVIHLLH